MSNKKYNESDIQAIAAAIRSKNGSQNTYTVSQMATAISNIQTQGNMSVSRTAKSNGGGTTGTINTDFTIGADVKEAYLFVDTIFYGNDNSFGLTRQSGAAVTISTKESSTSSNWDCFGCSPVRLRTITYKILKSDAASAVVRLAVTNPYGLGGICAHLVTI